MTELKQLTKLSTIMQAILDKPFTKFPLSIALRLLLLCIWIFLGLCSSCSRLPERSDAAPVTWLAYSPDKPPGPGTHLAATEAVATKSAPATVTNAQEYNVEGSFVYDLIKLPKEDHLVLTRDYQVRFQKNRWEINVVCRDETNKWVFVHRYDGTNLLYFLAAPDEPMKAMSGVVEDASVPYFWTSAGGAFPWLAFASGPYFKSRTNQMSLSLRDLSTGRIHRRYEVPCHWALADSPPFLPKRVQYVKTGIPYLNESGSVVFMPLSPPFQNGYVYDEFKSGSFTNVGSYSLPLDFEFRSYVPQPDAKTTNDLRCVLIVKGVTTNISLTSVVTNRISQQKIYLRDTRLPENPVNYMVTITNGIIPSTNNSFIRRPTRFPGRINLRR